MKTLTNVLITCFLAVFALAVMSPAQAQPQLYFIHNDHLGTPQAVTDQNQQIVWRGRQQPFGQTEETTDTIPQNARFPGQYLDEESGFYYNYFRDYDPSVGRYVQSDPIGLMGGLNTFAYALQNPIVNFDPDGLFTAGTPTCFGGICLPGGVAKLELQNAKVTLKASAKVAGCTAVCTIRDNIPSGLGQSLLEDRLNARADRLAREAARNKISKTIKRIKIAGGLGIAHTFASCAIECNDCEQ